MLDDTRPSVRKTLAVGDTGRFTKTIFEQDVFEFAGASGDFNPLHIDDQYAQQSVFGRRVAHGILMAGIISAVLGGDIPGVGTIFVELHIDIYTAKIMTIGERAEDAFYIVDDQGAPLSDELCDQLRGELIDRLVTKSSQTEK